MGAARDPRRTLVESYLCLARRRARRARDAVFAGDAVMNTEHEFIDTNRHLVEIPDRFAIARWSRDADVATIARCILGTLKYEPHTADTAALRQALEGVIEHTARGGSGQKGEDSEPKREENPMSKPDIQADQMTAEQLLAILRRRATEIQRQSGDQ